MTYEQEAAAKKSMTTDNTIVWSADTTQIQKDAIARGETGPIVATTAAGNTAGTTITTVTRGGGSGRNAGQVIATYENMPGTLQQIDGPVTTTPIRIQQGPAMQATNMGPLVSYAPGVASYYSETNASGSYIPFYQTNN
jgi:hypothetical protein